MCQNKFKQVVTAPIESIDEAVRVTDEGHEFYVARLESELVDEELILGGSVPIAKSVVDKFGLDKLVGKRVRRWIPAE